jgi:predicted RNA-binding protein with PUA-like domain
MVDIKFKQKFPTLLSLKEIKTMPDIQDIGLVKKGHRLSIMPVPENEWHKLMNRVE